MKKRQLRITAFLVLICMVLITVSPVYAETERTPLEISAASGLLMEVETGTILYEKDSNTRRSPASVTKVMTLLLIFEQLDAGNLKLDDTVTTSAHAKSMGGSQVFLEEGEQQSVETMIKCIVIASGNDASVAMAEHIAGSEQSFVEQMNRRASELGMKNTHFVDCCGLTDSDDHYTTAYDIALMSRELIKNHPQIFQYSSIWMENITHVTRQGTKEFGLTNTNRLIRTYPGCKGLKTGSTSKAKFCLSAVAERGGLSLLSVVMAAPDYKARLKDCASLLDYGFARCSIYIDEQPSPLPEIPVRKGTSAVVPLQYEGTFKYVSTDGNKLDSPQKKLNLPEEIQAPVSAGEQAGELVYLHPESGQELGSIPVLYAESVECLNFSDCLLQTFHAFCL